MFVCFEGIMGCFGSLGRCSLQGHKEVWRSAMIHEIEGLVANDTFTINEWPLDRKAL